jgi:OmpA-OmpF porin, OOP family
MPRLASTRSLLCIAALLSLVALQAHAARIGFVQGKVTIIRGEKTIPAVTGSRLQEGDELSSEADAQAFFKFDDGARAVIRADSQMIVKELKLKGPAATRQKTIRLAKGSLRYISGKATLRQKVAFETSTATIGIRGTDIEIVVTEEPVNDNNPGTFLKVNTGAATLAAPDGTSVDVAAGEVVYGGEPELSARGAGGKRRASARAVQAVGGLFKASSLDRFMK